MNEVKALDRAPLASGTPLLERMGFSFFGVFCVSFVLLVAGWLIKGDLSEAIRPDSDDFVRAGKAFIHWVASGGVGYEAAQSHAVFPYYFVPSVILAAIYMYFDWPVLTAVGLNSVLFSLLVALIYRFWTSVHGTWTEWTGRQGLVIGWAGGMYIIFGLPDAFLLSYTVLSDIIFLFWVTLFVVFVSQWILDGGKGNWTTALVVAAAAPFFRPTGVLLPILLVYVVFMKKAVEADVELRNVVAISIGVPVLITFVVVPWLVAAKLGGEMWVETVVPDMFQRYFNIAANFFERGTVVSNRPDTYVETPTGYTDVLKMVIYRLWYFWVPLRFGESPYSLVHNLVNLCYVAVAWPLMIIGIRHLARSDRQYKMVALFLVVVALGYAFLHSMTLLSFSWRYQLPGMVPLWMLAGVGLYSLLGRPAGSPARMGQSGAPG